VGIWWGFDGVKLKATLLKKKKYKNVFFVPINFLYLSSRNLNNNKFLKLWKQNKKLL
jgi:hypothetical protein